MIKNESGMCCVLFAQKINCLNWELLGKWEVSKGKLDFSYTHPTHFYFSLPQKESIPSHSLTFTNLRKNILKVWEKERVSLYTTISPSSLLHSFPSFEEHMEMKGLNLGFMVCMCNQRLDISGFRATMLIRALN